jgi:hypothetical protein
VRVERARGAWGKASEEDDAEQRAGVVGWFVGPTQTRAGCAARRVRSRVPLRGRVRAAARRRQRRCGKWEGGCCFSRGCAEEVARVRRRRVVLFVFCPCATERRRCAGALGGTVRQQPGVVDTEEDNTSRPSKDHEDVQKGPTRLKAGLGRAPAGQPHVMCKARLPMRRPARPSWPCRRILQTRSPFAGDARFCSRSRAWNSCKHAAIARWG